MYLAFNHTSDIYQSLSQRGKTWCACFLHFHGFSISALQFMLFFGYFEKIRKKTQANFLQIEAKSIKKLKAQLKTKNKLEYFSK